MPMQQRSDLTPPLGGGMKGYFPFCLTPLRFHVFLKKCVLPILIGAKNMKAAGNRVIA